MMAETPNGNNFNKAHPITSNNGITPGGFFQKLIKFAMENPLVTVMGALVALGILFPEDKKKSW